MGRHRHSGDLHSSDSAVVAEEFVGGTYGGWVKVLPKSWIPYIQMARLSTVAPIGMVFSPHLFGIFHALITHEEKYSARDVGYKCILLVIGSFFYSNAAHVWNDVVDAPFDKQMDRSRHRPIPRGAVTVKAAFLFVISQPLAAASVLLFLPPITAVVTVPSILAATYYPWAKRHVSIPQIVLGFCLGWGIMVGSASLSASITWHDGSALCLVAAFALVMVIYDTLYAYQDLPDDLRLGLNSLPVLCGRHTKLVLWLLSSVITSSLCLYGILENLRTTYFVFTVGCSALSTWWMLYEIKLEDPQNCWSWFTSGSLLTSSSFAAGLYLECIL